MRASSPIPTATSGRSPTTPASRSTSMVPSPFPISTRCRPNCLDDPGRVGSFRWMEAISRSACRWAQGTGQGGKEDRTMVVSSAPSGEQKQSPHRRGMNARQIAVWTAVSIVAAIAWGAIALARGERISAIWLVAAAVGSYAIGYRFYARFIANRVLGVDETRATPAERLDNGVDFVPTDRRVLFGHHFAAIAGAGPLVGPVLAAQMGYLPGTIWIIVGVVFAGAVQDM